MIRSERTHDLHVHMAVVLAATWNVAAINNNPFEYWVTYPDDEYNEFMLAVEKFLRNADEDLPVNELFTESMFTELIYELDKQGIPQIDELSRVWLEDYSRRKAISGFLKDRSIGEKRLTSMPDRITNTINLASGAKLKRPSVINTYTECALTSMEIWWKQWRIFMFSTYVQIFSKGNTEPKPQLVCNLIGPIQRKKYPAISAEEQRISVQLQLLCLAILDAIFIHIVNRVAPTRWESIRRTLSCALIDGKDERLCQILADSYLDRHVIFLQEASAALVQRARAHSSLSERFAVLLPDDFDPRREQNSIILVDRRRFDATAAEDATQLVLSFTGDFLAPGDLFAASISDCAGQRWLLVSFHGDSAGLSTAPTLRAVHRVRRALPGHVLLAGLDANTHSHGGDPRLHGVAAFRTLLVDLGVVSVWDGAADPFVQTTCGARTSLQTQLSKAVEYHCRFSAASVSLKDWLLGYAGQVCVSPMSVLAGIGILLSVLEWKFRFIGAPMIQLQI
jgi:hypothetical protein